MMSALSFEKFWSGAGRGGIGCRRKRFEGRVRACERVCVSLKAHVYAMHSSQRCAVTGGEGSVDESMQAVAPAKCPVVVHAPSLLAHQ